MITYHVIYDPTNTITVGPPDRLPRGVKFIAMKADGPAVERVEETVGKLAKLLLEQL
jgi:hypothetical protein